MLSHTSTKQLEKKNPHTAPVLEELAVLAAAPPPAALFPASLKSTWQDHVVGREEAGSLSESLDRQPTWRGSADNGGAGDGAGGRSVPVYLERRKARS